MIKMIVITALTVAGLVVFALCTTVTRPIGARERINSPVETCIINNDNNSIESCILTGDNND